jgi:hypothetical protein
MDSDTIQGFITKWNATTSLTTPISGGIYSGRAHSDPVMPYAKIKSQKAKEMEPDSCGSYIDYRKVTIEVYQVGEVTTGDLLKTIMETFNSTSLTLTIPNSSFRQCWLIEDTLEQDPKTKDGDDVWIGRAIFEVMSTRLTT